MTLQAKSMLAGVAITAVLLALFVWSTSDCKVSETREVEVLHKSKYGMEGVKKHTYKVCLER